MRLARSEGIDEYYGQAERHLLEHEAEHNLILGACVGLMRDPVRPERPPYATLVEERGEVIASALMIPPGELLLSISPSPAVTSLIARDLRERFPELPAVIAPAPSCRGGHVSVGRRRSGIDGEPQRSHAERHQDRQGLHPSRLQGEGLRPRLRRRAQSAPARLRLPVLLPLRRPEQSDGQPPLPEHRLPARRGGGGIRVLGPTG